MPITDIARTRPVLPNYRVKTSFQDPLTVWVQRQIGALQELVSRLSQDPDLTQSSVFQSFLPVVLLSTFLATVRIYAISDNWPILTLVSVALLVDLALLAMVWVVIRMFTRAMRAFLKQDWILDPDDCLVKKQ